ncbi:hypothetical protein Pint_14010 [Pistacia integerrima]|uniref:Uncharacterized protein n=1 Tax=Pistacia integerrima TaxID=434235 RepID=A0ACC0YAW2_9ROSI|nr:hypothetical protein Pint_14010 [Pistacia integerrima]
MEIKNCFGEVPRGKGFKCTGGIMASEAVSLFRNFYEQGNPNGSSKATQTSCSPGNAMNVLVRHVMELRE